MSMHSAFLPGALSRLDRIFDDAWEEFFASREGLDAQHARSALTRMIYRVASGGGTDNQIRQLVFRALNNQATRQGVLSRYWCEEE
jgi:hypothetical protein